MWFLLLAAVTASAGPTDVIVNRYATVTSADGYVNLHNTPSTEYAPRLRVPTGQRVLVRTCTSATPGRRWCQVVYGEDVGYAYDAELTYAPLRVPADGTALGAGVADGFAWVDEEAVIVSADGYLNLRAGPSASRPVMRRLPSDDFVFVLACEAGPRGRRWCFVNAGPRDVVGYVYDRELEYVTHEH